MPNFAFSGGVKPGGLTSSTEIKILLCYLLQTVGHPLTEQEVESALVGEELVNYFEYAHSLALLCENGLLTHSGKGYSVTKEGAEVATTLSRELPFTVKETAVRAAVRARQFTRKKAEHHVLIAQNEQGSCVVTCSIEEMGAPVFRLELAMPDKWTAEQVKTQFVQNGDEIFKLLLSALTEPHS